MRMNAFHNVGNPHQGPELKVLCVCSAGLLRSPTTAVVLANEYGYNTRAAGVNEEYALIPVTDLLIHWADSIVCMQEEHYTAIKDRIPKEKSVVILDIPDNFKRMDPILVGKIKDSYRAKTSEGP